ncbi:uncharacterized protein DEA37_0001854 [Paragonimus westermani]|uniref:Uncharacterized protein n=1 Tax=Paragonimus westermani TaxID=34504 RepID=A0A5J4NUD2_9TREM|nr:uncharacterized protein DEA37_0001854 [Paragonimus westermani]
MYEVRFKIFVRLKITIRSASCLNGLLKQGKVIVLFAMDSTQLDSTVHLVEPYESSTDSIATIVIVRKRGTPWYSSVLIIVNAGLGASLLAFPQAYNLAGGIAISLVFQTNSLKSAVSRLGRRDGRTGPEKLEISLSAKERAVRYAVKFMEIMQLDDSSYKS